MRSMRFIAPALFGLQLLFHQALTGIWRDLVAFNSVAIACIASVLVAPRVNSRWAQPLVALALGSWSLGSVIATSTSYVDYVVGLANFSDVMYLIFYPLALLGLQQLISNQQKLSILEIIDASIVALGLSTLGAAFAIHPVLPHFDGDFGQSFLAIIYPVADLVLLCFIVATVAMQGFSIRGLLLTVGVVLYTATDFLFLWQNLNMSYAFGSLVD
jgi:hypothetical protein